MPEFSFEQLKRSALSAQADGGFKTAYADLTALATPKELVSELDELRRSIFDPTFEPMITAKSPQGGLDIVQASSNTFYPGLSLNDLKDFHDAIR